VRVTAEYERDALELVFEDDGPGIDADELSAVVKRGVRLDEKAPGAGLGLAIVADLAARHGGEIRFDRSPLGGLRVALELAEHGPC
jgi:signal transduction histidine kinase